MRTMKLCEGCLAGRRKPGAGWTCRGCGVACCIHMGRTGGRNGVPLKCLNCSSTNGVRQPPEARP
jgi:hypothetical protein